MWFEAHNFVLDIAQAGCVALPAAGLPARLSRFGGRGWAVVLPLSIALVVGVIALAPGSADVLTWVALLLVPPGCALALGWAAHGARPWLATLVVPLLVVAWAPPGAASGELAGAPVLPRPAGGARPRPGGGGAPRTPPHRGGGEGG